MGSRDVASYTVTPPLVMRTLCSSAKVDQEWQLLCKGVNNVSPTHSRNLVQ